LTDLTPVGFDFVGECHLHADAELHAAATTRDECAQRCESSIGCQYFYLSSGEDACFLGVGGNEHGSCGSGPGYQLFAKSLAAYCTACVAGKYKDINGSAPCEHCPPDSHSQQASGSSDECLCNAGWTGADGGPCAPCAVGRYKNASGSAECSLCPLAASSPGGATVCECNAGYTGADGGPCGPCPVDFYKPAPGDAVCSGCQAHSGAAPASTICPCDTGWFGEYECDSCPDGFFQQARGSAVCEPCPAHSDALAGSDRLADCVCMPGFSGHDGGPCVACPAGQYKSAWGSGECLLLPAFAEADGNSFACETGRFSA